MAKHIIYVCMVFAALLPSATWAQTPIKYEEVVEVQGADKAELYRRARRFFVDEFKDANEVLQTQDEAAGELVAKGAFLFEPKHFSGSAVSPGVIWFTISVYVKDGKYKYIIENLIHEATRHKPNAGPYNYGMLYDSDLPLNCDFCNRGFKKIADKMCKENYLDMKSQADTYAKNMISQLKAAMQKASGGGSDW